MSHQMIWYILAHMPYFRRPGHILCRNYMSLAIRKLHFGGQYQHVSLTLPEEDKTAAPKTILSSESSKG